MNIDADAAASVDEASRSFSRVVRIAEEHGKAVLFKNNHPRFILTDADKSPVIEMTDDEKIDFVAARILKEHKKAFLEPQNDQAFKRRNPAAA